MSSAEERVRQALERGRAPASGDIEELMDELERVRRESEERWQAIGRLAPAAKAHRARTEAQGRAMAELGRHVDALAAMMDGQDSIARDTLGAWVRRARELLKSGRS